MSAEDMKVTTPQPLAAAAAEEDALQSGFGRRAQRFLAERTDVVLAAVLVTLVLFTHLVSTTGFLKGDQFTTTMRLACPLALIAAGQTLVMLTAGIDLSVANTATSAAYVISTAGHRGAAQAIAIALCVGLAVGLVNGIGVAIFRVNPLIMTLGMSMILLGALTVYAQGFVGNPQVPDFVQELGGGHVLHYIPTNLLLWAPVAAAVILGLRATGLGRMIYAIGDNPEACRLAGVRVWQVQIAVYTLCGLLAALGGIVLAGLIGNVDLNIASTYLLPSVAACVIGGISIFGGVGGYSGTILGALILTVLDALLVLLDYSEQFKSILYGVIVLLLAWMYGALARST